MLMTMLLVLVLAKWLLDVSVLAQYLFDSCVSTQRANTRRRAVMADVSAAQSICYAECCSAAFQHVV